MANYKTSDFKEDASIGSVYDLAKDALMNVLSVQSAPYTAESALTQSDKTEYAVTTSVTTSATGDRAYVPYSTSNETVTFLLLIISIIFIFFTCFHTLKYISDIILPF